MASSLRSPRLAKGTVQSFGDDKRSRDTRKSSDHRAKYLSQLEINELTYMWHDYDAELGVRSIQGAIENRLLTAPPRDDARPHIVAELERAGGRAPEGKVLTIVVAEGWGTKYEVRRSLQLLVLHKRVRREVSESQPQNLPDDWTGTDLILADRERGEIGMTLALKSVHWSLRSTPRKTRWQSQDDDLERMWLTIPCGSGSAGYRNYAPDDVRQSATAERILGHLCKMPTQAVSVLHRVYGPRPRSIWASIWTDELGPLVELTAAVEIERQKLAAGILHERRGVTLDLAMPVTVDEAKLAREALAAVSAADAVRSGLTQGVVAREAFVKQVGEEAGAMLRDASGEYRKARRRT